MKNLFCARRTSIRIAIFAVVAIGVGLVMLWDPRELVRATAKEEALVQPIPGSAPSAHPVKEAVRSSDALAMARPIRALNAAFIESNSLGRNWGSTNNEILAGFYRWAKEYSQATSDQQREEMRAEGEAYAVARRVELKRLIEVDPKAAIDAAVPLVLRAQLPASVQGLLETVFSEKGDLNVVAVTGLEGVAAEVPVRRWVGLSSGRFRAFVYGSREYERSRTAIPLVGISVDDVAAIHESPILAAQLMAQAPSACAYCLGQASDGIELTRAGQATVACSASHAEFVKANWVEGEAANASSLTDGAVEPDSHSIPVSWTHGAKRLLVIRADFPDLPGTPRYPGGSVLTDTATADLVRRQVAPWYDEVSYGRLQLSAVVSTSVYRLPRTASAYATQGDLYGIYNDAAAAAAANYAVDQFDFVTILTPFLGAIPGSQIRFAGASEVQARKSWINGYFDLRTVSHEIGHNLGLFHANLWRVIDGDPISPDGISEEYGDQFDAMGSSGGSSKFHFNPWFKSLLGWLPETAVRTVSTSTTQRIYRMDDRNADAHVVALKVRASEGRDYWLAYRAKFAELSNGVTIVRGYSAPRNSELIDVNTPGSLLNDAALQVGSSFADPSSGVSFRVVARGGEAPNDYQEVEIVVDGAPERSDSQIVPLQGIVLEAPTNDNLVNAQQISSPTGSITGNNSTATGEIGEQSNYQKSVWYAFTSASSGAYTFDTVGTEFDSTLTVYTGSTYETLTQIAYNDDYNGLTSKVVINATAGTTYRIRLSGLGGFGGPFYLNWGPLPAPRLTSPAVVTIQPGNSFSYNITADQPMTSWNAVGLPPGVSVVSYYPQITGTTTATGLYLVPVTVANASGSTTTNVRFEVLTPPIPSIISPLAATARVGSYFSYMISALGNPTSYNAVGLPPGLTVSNGYISGQITDSASSAGTYMVTISAANSQGTASETLTIYVAPKPAPEITSQLDVVTYQGQSFYYSIAATNSPTSYNAEGLPPGLTVSTWGTISGQPTASGVYIVTLRAANASGTGSANLWLRVAVPPPPTVTSALSAVGTVGAWMSYDVRTSGIVTSYSASGLPAGLQIDSASGYISGTPTTAGTYNVSLSATNAGGTTTVTAVFNIAAQTVPRITSPTYLAVILGSSSYYYISASGNPTSYSADGLPPGVTVSTGSGVLSGAPTVAGRYLVTMGATNTAGTGTATLIMDVLAQAPVVTSASVAGLAGQPFNYSIVASNLASVFTVSNLPPGLSLNTSTGVISGAPTAIGSYIVPVAAGNGRGFGYGTLTINVTAPSAPVITSSMLTNGQVGQPFQYSITTNIPANSYNAEGLPAGLAINQATGVISGTPTAPGSYIVTIRAANYGGATSNQLTIALSPQAAPGITSGLAQSAQVGVPFNYTITASNSPLTYNAIGLPLGLSVDANTGVVSGTSITAGTYNVVIRASNYGGTAEAVLVLNVIPAAPVITSALSVIAYVGTPFSYQISATQSPNSFNAPGLPNGLVVNTSNGAISGIPTGVSGRYGVVLTAANAGGVATATLWIDLQPAANLILEQINGSVGYPLSYALSSNATPFAAFGLPPGVSMDSTSGVISGIPEVEGMFNVTVTSGGKGAVETQLILAVGRAPLGAIISRTQSDVIIRNRADRRAAVVVLQDSGTASQVELPALPEGMEIVGAADFDEDGRNDLLVSNTATGQSAVWLMIGEVVKQSVALPSASPGWSIKAVGYFDGDISPDIVLQNSATGELQVWIMDGVSRGSIRPLPALSSNWTLSGIASLFQDSSTAALLVYNSTTGEHAALRLDSSLKVVTTYAIGEPSLDWIPAGVSYFNGVGLPMLVLQNTSNGAVAAWALSGSSVVDSISLPSLSPSWDLAGVNSRIDP
jgi:hypothetical protein